MGSRRAALALATFLAAPATPANAGFSPPVGPAEPNTTGRIASAAGVYDSSTTPAGLPWNTYNYCNAPHVNVAHYTMPNASDAKLVYMNVVIRHHKVRPRARSDIAHA